MQPLSLPIEGELRKGLNLSQGRKPLSSRTLKVPSQTPTSPGCKAGLGKHLPMQVGWLCWMPGGILITPMYLGTTWRSFPQLQPAQHTVGQVWWVPAPSCPGGNIPEWLCQTPELCSSDPPSLQHTGQGRAGQGSTRGDTARQAQE